MIIKTHRIVFRADRSPMPEWLNIGYEGDNMVERLEVILPKISDRQRAYLMIGESEYANMVDMIADGDVRYHVDLTAELVGKAGAAQAYIAIDGDDGSTWHSGIFRLNTGDLPAVNKDIAEHYPDAVERMREEISEHRDEMAEQTEVVADAANRAEEAAKKAEEAAGSIEPGGGAANVPEWALQPQKPEYGADEVGAVANVDGVVKTSLTLGATTGEDAKKDSYIKLWRRLSSNGLELFIQLYRRTGTNPSGSPAFTTTTIKVGEIETTFDRPINFKSENSIVQTRTNLDVYSKGEVDEMLPDVSDFITRLVDDLENYYSKAETYTRSEIDRKISAIPKFEIRVVDTLPADNISADAIYLLRDGVDGNLYTEYIYIAGTWEILGSQRLDLAGYATEAWVSGQLSGYQPKGDYALRSELPTVPKKLSELADDSTHRLTTDAEKAAWNSKSNFSGAYADLTGAPTIPTVPTKVSAFENDAKYLTQHQDISGKLDANKLPEAIDTALAQAKASGEFDGKNGDDGFSPTVATSKDGKVTTITIADKDGPKTATIHDGVDGYTPVKGKDYSDGLNGVSPTVSVATITGGHRITIEDTNGNKTVDVLNGAKGDAGRGITSVTRTSGNGAAGTTDTYTITYTDDSTTTFGVYNGKNGTNGTSVTVSEVTESNVDGGSNVVRFSDGNAVTIKNGSKGSPGSDATVTAASVKSALGYTPASEAAVKQISEEIAEIGTREEIVQAVIAVLPVYNGEVV